MNNRRNRLKNLKNILRDIYGRCITEDRIKKYHDMDEQERYILHQRYDSLIESDLKLINEILNEESNEAYGTVLSRFRNAEGIDPDMIDDIMEYADGPGDYPVDT